MGDLSRLFLDYVSDIRKGVPPFLQPVSNAAFSDLGAGSREESSWRAVIDELRDLNTRIGAGQTVLSKIESDGVRFVVTGQQPGTFGGPLHTAYKIATAIALAQRVEADSGVPCVPLYWCGADDSDFHEIREVHLLTETLSPLSSAIPQKAHPGGLPVGDIAVEHLSALWESVGGVVDAAPHGAFVREVVERASDNAHDHGELSASILLGLFDGRFAVVDGRSRAVRRHARAVFAQFVAEEPAIKDTISKAGRALESAGYHAQLNVGTDSGVFLVEGGIRKSVMSERLSDLAKIVDSEVERCSPGVILRNLVQDFTFEPLAVVLGPAEIAYRAQIESLYDRFGIKRPLDIPRLTGTFLPAPLDEMVDGTSAGDVELMIGHPAEFARAIYGRCVPDELTKSFDEFTSTVREAIEKLAQAAAQSATQKARGKIDARLGDIQKRVDNSAQLLADVGKAVAKEKWPFLGDVDRIIRPGGKPQERTLSSLMLFAHCGDLTHKHLRSFAVDHVTELLDGDATHIVFSSKS